MDLQLHYQFSSSNVLMTQDFIERILTDVLDTPTKINDLDIYQLAFTHKSVVRIPPIRGLPEHFPAPRESNERLEYLGDGFIKAIVGEYMYDRFPGQDEGFLTIVRIKIEKGSTLCYFANELHLKRRLLVSQYIENNTKDEKTGRNSPNLSEDLFEALCGAIVKDLGYSTLCKFMIKIMEKMIDFSEIIMKEDNWKSIISRCFRKNGLGYPEYTLIETSSSSLLSGIQWVAAFEDFDVPTVTISESEHNFLVIGHGETKKEAEQCAARLAIDKLKEYRVLEQLQALREQRKLNTGDERSDSSEEEENDDHAAAEMFLSSDEEEFYD